MTRIPALPDEEPWSSIRDIVDETWFISCPVDTAMDRVLARQVLIGFLQRSQLL